VFQLAFISVPLAPMETSPPLVSAALVPLTPTV